ncbi:MAG: hypothetical protein IT515_16045 [Burkholderiales bacterium]|nr:hypothetical protein [Burkholderiales bacterium]
MKIKTFDDRTRRELESSFRDSLLKARPDFDPEGAEEEAEIFVGGLERIAGLEEFRGEREPQQRRRENLEAFANALDRAIEAGLRMDDHSLGYALERGLDEIKAREGADSLRIQLIAYDLKAFHAGDLRNFALGVRKAIRDLPALDPTTYSSGEQTARWIEDYLARLGIPVSQTDTGLAGKAFHAVMELAGKPQTTAKNWLRKTQKQPDSFVNFLRGLKARFWH